MAIFNSYVTNYQRVTPSISHDWWWTPPDSHDLSQLSFGTSTGIPLATSSRCFTACACRHWLYYQIVSLIVISTYRPIYLPIYLTMIIYVYIYILLYIYYYYCYHYYYYHYYYYYYIYTYILLYIHVYITIYIYVPIIPTNPFPFPAEPQCSRARAAQVAIRNFGGPPLGGDALDPLILDIPCPITMWGPLVINWFINPINYSYKYHKP